MSKNSLAELLNQMHLDKTAAAPDEPTAVNTNQQSSDPLAMASDVATRINNFLQAGQGQVDPAGVQNSTDPQQSNALAAGNNDVSGGVSRVQLEIPQGMTIKVAHEIKTRDEAVRFLLAYVPEAFVE